MEHGTSITDIPRLRISATKAAEGLISEDPSALLESRLDLHRVVCLEFFRQIPLVRLASFGVPMEINLRMIDLDLEWLEYCDDLFSGTLYTFLCFRSSESF